MFLFTVYFSAPGATGRVAMSSVRCSGVESTLLACENDGFFAPPSGTCAQHVDDLGVVCQDEGRHWQSFKGK